MKKNEVKSILIVKLGAIGDVVMSLSMLEAIKENYKDAEVTWIIGRAAYPILQNFEQIKELCLIDDAALLKGSIFARLKVLISVWTKFFLKEFDLVVIPYRDKRYKLLTLTIKGKRQSDFMGLDRLNTIIPGRYHASEYRKLITHTDDWKMKDPSTPKIELPKNERIDEFLASSNSPRVVLAPGGSKNLLADDILRRWPVEYYRQLCSCLIEKGINVILIGAETDRWVEEEFKGLNTINLIGKTSLIDLIYLFSKSKLLVTHDTGSLQIAKLTEITSIALFGPVNPRERIGELDNVEAIWGGQNLPCSPCYDGKNFAKCDNNICMKNISVKTVTEAVLSKIFK